MTPSPVLLGLATALPSGSVKQQDAAEAARTQCCSKPEHERLLTVLYRRTHVSERSSVLIENGAGHAGSLLSFFPAAQGERDFGPSTRDRMLRYSEDAPLLAFDASIGALADAGVRPEEITHLVTVSCTGFEAPGVDVALMEALRLRNDISRTHIGFMGCHGALNGMRVAAAYAKADPAARVLLCAVELCSLHFHYGWDPDKIVANALFADGAAAAVIGQAGARKDRWRVIDNGACIFPGSTDAMSWRIGNHGFVMTLSSRVPDLIGTHLRPWFEGWLGKNGLKIGDVGSWAIHPGGPRIIDAVAKAIGIPEEATAASRAVLGRCGNMSSPTVLFIVEELKRAGGQTPCVGIGFGPGLAAEAVLLGAARESGK